MNILITGATGNVGIEVIKALSVINSYYTIKVGVREPEKYKNNIGEYPILVQRFDFKALGDFDQFLSDCDILFLLRPPQLSKVSRYFKPLIKAAKKSSISHIVFLSVQGAEKNKLIPHNKIEKLIVESNIPYTFLRPAYFMQNFLTTLRSDLVNQKIIFLPAGKARFTLVDVKDIGAVTARVLINSGNHINKIYELTCNERLTFGEMADKLTKILGVKVNYISPTLLWFFIIKRKQSVPFGLILVMIMLHFLPRFQREPIITDNIKKITSKNPITFEEFINENIELLN